MLDKILDGVRVVDLTQNVAGPFCTQILGDLGATIIKIERPGPGDDTREWRQPAVAETSATFLALNRNKSSVCVDIAAPRGADVVRDLVASADVFIHSMKPGSAERRRLGHSDLSQANPRLIYAAISAFGNYGPMRELPGYDPLLQAFSGIMSVTGNEGDAPIRVGVSLIDMGTGMWSALGVLAGVLRRAQTGEGMMVEASLLDTGLSWMSIVMAGYMATGTLPRKMGSAMAMTAPYELFHSSDGHVFIAAGNDRLFRAVCTGLGAEALAIDPRFIDNVARVQNRVALLGALETVTTCLTTAEIVQRLRKVGAPCSPLNDVSQVLVHPQVTASGILAALPLPGAPDHRVVDLPLMSMGARGRNPVAPPELGEHTDAELTRIGYSSDHISSLRSDGSIV